MKKSSVILTLVLVFCLAVTGVAAPARAEKLGGREKLAAEITESLSKGMGESYEFSVQVYCPDEYEDYLEGKVSWDYIEELQFNTRQTEWFGYYLDEIDAEMGGENWIFTVDENGETVYRKFVPYDGAQDILKYIAVGAAIAVVVVVVVVLVVEGIITTNTVRTVLNVVDEAPDVCSLADDVAECVQIVCSDHSDDET